MDTRKFRRIVLSSCGCLVIGLPFSCAAEEMQASQDRPASESLRERLTEREDENRIEQPWTTDLFGHPLSATLQYEVSSDWVRQLSESDPPGGETRVLFEQLAEGEVFYSTGPGLSLLLQARAGMERDLLSNTRRGVSDVFIERGEMWLHSEQAFGSQVVGFDIGRLDFEDDRRWWWDEDLDAVRVTAGGDSFELAVAVAKELGPTRSDRDFIEPDHEDVVRLIGEVSWDWRDNHSLQLFTLLQDDRSRTHNVGDLIDLEREDESDANLRWFGARAAGAWPLRSGGGIGYWFDAAWVNGDEYVLEFTTVSPRQREVEERERRSVRGWGFDVGATWLIPSEFEPRLTLGYARGSGDTDPDDAHDRSFRQTGLNANSPGFGGVQSFSGYGLMLDPDLSNIEILTAGAGVSLWQATSLDVVYHRYRQIEASDSLGDARLTASLTATDRDLGDGLDLVLAIEESDRIEFELWLSTFHAGDAFGALRGRWTFGGFAALRLAF
jgi:alginate production protein